MVTIQYRKVKCDICGKTVEMKESYGNHPMGWYVVEATRWYGNRGEGKYSKEVCSLKCLTKAMHDFKSLPRQDPAIII